MSERIPLFGIEIDPLRMSEAVTRVSEWLASGERACRYVVTPNVDHAVMYQENPFLRAAYAEASLVLADGAPVVWASRLLKRPLPERVTGADLTPALFGAASPERETTVFLLGAGPGVGQRAAKNIAEKWPHVKVVGTYSPPLGFEKSEPENEHILGLINAQSPDILVLGLGAPKQELWIHKHHRRIQAGTALCVGAAIDFLAGEKRRAPVLMQNLGLEWMHRLATEPRRLVNRYARDAWLFPQLVWKEYRAQA